MATTDANGFITIENSDLFNISHANGNAAAASAVADRVTTAEGNISDIQTALGTKVDKVDGKGLSTEDYTSAEKTKLAGVEAGANAYTLPAATSEDLGGVKQGANVSIAADGTLSATDTTYGEATTGSAGLMSAADKTKLDDIADYYTRSNFITEVKVVTDGGGTVETATDYTLNAGARFQKIEAKSPKTGFCYWNIQFYFNDARTIAAGTRLRFYYANAANDMAKVYGQGIVMADTNLGTKEYVGVWAITSYLNCIEVYLEKPTVSVLITQVTTGTYKNS